MLPRLHLVLSTEPLSQPLCRVRINRRCVGRTGRTDRTEAVIVRPAGQHPVEATDLIPRVHPSVLSGGLRADLAADALNALRAGPGADRGAGSRLADVASDAIPKDRERFLPTIPDSARMRSCAGRVIVHRPFALCHHRRDRRPHIRCPGSHRPPCRGQHSHRRH